MNKVTKQEREALIARAAELTRQGYDAQGAAAQLQAERSVSRQRARHAVAKARMRARRP